MNLAIIISEAVKNGQILESAAANLEKTYQEAPENSWERKAIEELADKGLHTEINDRFYKRLAFGTGGLRGRTIGKTVVPSELGTPDALGCPEHPCVGTNAMNDANVERAARGVCRYMRKCFPSIQPTIVISHDTRHFSRKFAELVARVAVNEGVNACLFPGDRSTPQLSFMVRHIGAQVGVMITASHNPQHDNGFKAYFEDGGQFVEPHASEAIKEVNAASLSQDFSPNNGASIRILGADEDTAYLDALESVVLDKELLKRESSRLKIVFTPIHGTGIRSIEPIMKRLGIDLILVPEQNAPDGRFPTVKSPNPENGEALSMGIALAKKHQADAVIATDPDCDRMGVALRNSAGEYELITGNQIGSILAHYRVTTLFDKGVLTPANAKNACLIKTFVTTELQAAIAKRFGLKIVNTLTGFKYIGEKMLEYEKKVMAQNPSAKPYRQQSPEEKRAAHLAGGCFYVFGGEESYGYSGGDYVRDKDANAATVMFAEAAAAAKSRGLTLLEYLDQIYASFGYYLESLGQIVMEGAEGSAKIARLLKSYTAEPPKALFGMPVAKVENFAEQNLSDVDGKPIPKELMFMFHLSNGARVAVRGSGTEPKVKFYLFANKNPDEGKSFTVTELAEIKAEVKKFIADLWPAIESDAMQRAC